MLKGTNIERSDTGRNTIVGLRYSDRGAGAAGAFGGFLSRCAGGEAGGGALGWGLGPEGWTVVKTLQY